MGNPWEMVRNDVSYPVKFYGQVKESSEGRKEWVGGEDIVALAYDVPIPGYRTKTTINLRLWSTKVASEAFDLGSFNNGDHAKAYEAMKRAEKVCIFVSFLLVGILLLFSSAFPFFGGSDMLHFVPR